MNYIANAFSLQMVPSDHIILCTDISPEEVPRTVKSCIGHTDTAAIVSAMLGFEIPANRESITLKSGDYLYVAQVVGGRLPEGTTTLPDGVSIIFKRVFVIDRNKLWSCCNRPDCVIQAFYPEGFPSNDK
jgi:hypothetical protein|nr:MAG TPA: DNA binding protein [Caudoviricetes sp.]